MSHEGLPQEGAIASGREGVLVLGVGLRTPWGKARHSLAGLLDGTTALTPNPFWDARSWPRSDCGWCAGFEPKKELPDRKAIKIMSREAQLAVAAAIEACGTNTPAHDAGIDADRVGVFGTAGYEVSALDDVRELLHHSRDLDDPRHIDLRRAFTEGKDHYNPLAPLKTLPNMALYHVAQSLGAEGPHAALGASPASGLAALDAAISALLRGECDRAIVVACDCGLELFRTQMWIEAGLLPSVAPGEGAAALVLARQGPVGAPRITRPWLGQERRGVDAEWDARQRGAVLAGAAGGRRPGRLFLGLRGVDEADRRWFSALGALGLSDVPATATAPRIGWLGAAHTLTEVALAALLCQHTLETAVLVAGDGLAGDLGAVWIEGGP